MNILALTTITYIHPGDYAAAGAGVDELIVLADDKGSVYWKAFGTWLQGWLFKPDRQRRGRMISMLLSRFTILVQNFNRSFETRTT